MAQAGYDIHQPKLQAEHAYDLIRAQGQVSDFRRSLYELCPLLDGRLIEDQALSAHTANDIQHKLGRKLKGYQIVKDDAPPSSFRAYPSGTVNLANATDVQIQLNTVAYDVNGDFDTAAYDFTAPRDGLYQFSAVVGVVSLAVSDYYYPRLTVNGTPVDSGGTVATGATDNQVAPLASAAVRLSKDDAVTLEARLLGAGTPATIAGNVFGYFVGRLIREFSDGQSEAAVDDTEALRLYSTCARTVSLWVF